MDWEPNEWQIILMTIIAAPCIYVLLWVFMALF
jgi:hypothetical protein